MCAGKHGHNNLGCHGELIGDGSSLILARLVVDNKQQSSLAECVPHSSDQCFDFVLTTIDG